VDEGIADYTKAIEINPKSFGAYANRGKLRLTKGEYDGAIEDF
jgi:tetratricopeptide (TPR) repeat protein